MITIHWDYYFRAHMWPNIMPHLSLIGKFVWFGWYWTELADDGTAVQRWSKSAYFPWVPIMTRRTMSKIYKKAQDERRRQNPI